MSETKPENFHHSREWPCPACGVPQHSVVQLQLHYARHTPEEKDAAWAKVPAFWESKRQVFGLVRVGER